MAQSWHVFGAGVQKRLRMASVLGPSWPSILPGYPRCLSRIPSRRTVGRCCWQGSPTVSAFSKMSVRMHSFTETDAWEEPMLSGEHTIFWMVLWWYSHASICSINMYQYVSSINKYQYVSACINMIVNMYLLCIYHHVALHALCHMRI